MLIVPIPLPILTGADTLRQMVHIPPIPCPTQTRSGDSLLDPPQVSKNYLRLFSLIFLMTPVVS